MKAKYSCALYANMQIIFKNIQKYFHATCVLVAAGVTAAKDYLNDSNTLA